MAHITAEELYQKLLAIQSENPDPLTDLDLMQYGKVDDQMNQLIQEGKIIMNNDIMGSFKVLD